MDSVLKGTIWLKQFDRVASITSTLELGPLLGLLLDHYLAICNVGVECNIWRKNDFIFIEHYQT